MAFAGLTLAAGHAASLETRGIWRLRLGIEALLRRGKAAGKVMQRIAGHVAWAALLRRESLRLLGECNAFTNKYIDPLNESLSGRG